MGSLLVRALVIVLLAVGLGLVANQVSPRGLPLITPPKQAPKAEEFIALQKAKELWGSGTAIFLDAREQADFAAGHIGAAFNLPALAFDQHFASVAPMLTPESPVVVYCDGVECELSHRLTQTLRERGYTNVHMLFNGWTVWKQAGFPTEQGAR
jgi:rhodanese-related sulfurtransferase